MAARLAFQVALNAAVSPQTHARLANMDTFIIVYLRHAEHLVQLEPMAKKSKLIAFPVLVPALIASAIMAAIISVFHVSQLIIS